MIAILSLIAFLALHLGVERLTGAPFSMSFRLARGLGSIALAGMGFFALLHFRGALREVYVIEGRDALASGLVEVAVGHFLADVLLLGYGWWKEREPPRKDLLVHHALGLFAAGATHYFPGGAPLYLINFTTELMPVTTGVAALGSHRRSPSLERLGTQLRLAVIALWRVPLWLAMGAGIALNVLLRSPSEEARTVYGFSFVFLLITLSLDAFWIRKSVEALRRSESRQRARAH